MSCLGGVLDARAADHPDALVAQAHAQHRQLPIRAQHVRTHAEIARHVGSARSRRDHDAVKQMQPRAHVLPRVLVVADHHGLASGPTDLGQLLPQVERVRVVVVHDQNAVLKRHTRGASVSNLAKS